MDVTIVDEERGLFRVYITAEVDECEVIADLQVKSTYSGNGGFPDEDIAKQAVVQFLELCANTYETYKMEFERDENDNLVMS